VRAPAAIQKGEDGTPSLGATLEHAAELAELGVTDVNVNLTVYARTEDELPAYYDELERRIATW
jgi:hypothetical protein